MPVGAVKCQKVPGAAKVPKRCIVGRVLQSANGCCKVPKGRSRFLFWKGAAKCQWVLQSAKRSLKISFLEGCCKVPMGAAKCQDTIAKPLFFFYGCEAPSSADKCQNVAIHLSH